MALAVTILRMTKCVLKSVCASKTQASISTSTKLTKRRTLNSYRTKIANR